MKYTKEVKSWNSSTNKDCFGLGGVSDIDHIWPISKKGSNISENKQKLSRKSNQEKANDTTGEINGFRFSVVRVTSKANSQGVQHIYGIMYIRKPEWEKGIWYKVINI